MPDLRPNTPPSKAVQAAREKLTPNSQTTHFDPEVHTSERGDATYRQRREDSFVAVIESRTPGKMIQSENSEIEDNTDENAKEDEKIEDSFVKHIITRSPIRPLARIEDSVEAIDALEDAIEKVGESIPHLEDPPESPIKAPRGRKAPIKPAASGLKQAEKGVSTRATKVTRTNRAGTSQNRTPGRPLPGKQTLAAPATSRKSSQPRIAEIRTASNGSNTSSKAPPTNRKLRVASITKAPFVPAKSAKPPTRSTFSLPGEAISHKLKQQREERLKREEEDNAKKRIFKARPTPARLSQMAPVVKSTIASKARLSMAQGVGKADDTLATAGPVIKPVPRVSSAGSKIAKAGAPTSTSASTSVTTVPTNRLTNRPSVLGPTTTNKRISVITVPSSTSTSTTTTKALAPRARTSTSLSPVPQAQAQAQFKSQDGIMPSQRKPSISGKEVMNRAKEEREEGERMRREKEDAAKKARKEAAERGRVASREWAEKMKMKGKREKAKEMEMEKETGMEGKGVVVGVA